MLAFVLMILLSQGVLLWLKFYTGHDQTEPVPDFTGMTIDEVAVVVRQQNLRFQVNDSVFTSGAAPGAVIQQNPLPGTRVKKDRTIFFMINATVPEQVMMPDLRGATLRMASSRLAAFGLKQGNLDYVNDMAVNSILKQRYNGRDVSPGTRIPRGASIDLVVGKGLASETAIVPDLIGLLATDARDTLNVNLLNVGSLIGGNAASGVIINSSARVTQQRPVAGSRLSLGGSVDLWLTVDDFKLPE